VLLEFFCPPACGVNLSRLRGAAGLLHAAAVTAARLRVGLLRFLAALMLVALSVQAVDTDRIVRSAQKYGPTGVANAKALQQMMAALAGQDDAAKIKAVNDFYNQRLAYMEDIDNWGVEDYWASPLEGLGKGAGDCEDYAIGKYFTLTTLGVPDARLRMVYVRASIPGAPKGYVAHMVLAYYPTPDADPLVLDNLQPGIHPASERPDLSPVFSFNAEGLWQGVGSIRAKGDPMTRLSKWRGAVMRARQDGFQ
jgi:predicted transglutaminase-like cysteine proteinase